MPEEREGFNKYIENGMIDSLRQFNQSIDQYTWWNPKIKSFRELNRGWRIDYCLVDKNIGELMEDSVILREVMGSDHCPIMLKIKV